MVCPMFFCTKAAATLEELEQKHGQSLFFYEFDDKEFVPLDSQQIIPPPGAIPSLLKNLPTAHIRIDKTMSLAKQFSFAMVCLTT